MVPRRPQWVGLAPPPRPEQAAKYPYGGPAWEVLGLHVRHLHPWEELG